MPAIRLAGVSKAYARYAHAADRLKALLWPDRPYGELFWALRDVTFEVPRGTTVGIVGRNGSGKSTLLQIVAQTLTPSAGEVMVSGRVSALLELGSGFNPEFTGRENVIFQGALMGLSRDQVAARFEEIVRFAEIGDFLDQPVKSYSSGMFVRLAFAVAVSFEPEILVVDEALSVGDEAFQRKCFARIRAIQEAGGTILFVSHSASAVVELCSTALLLDHGELLLAGRPKEVVARYHRLLFAPPDEQARLRQEILSGSSRPEAAAATGSEPEPDRDFFDPDLVAHDPLAYVSRGTEIEQPRLLSPSGKLVNVLSRRGEYVYCYRVRFREPAFKVRFGMLVKTVSGYELGGAVTHASTDGLDHVQAGEVAEVRFRYRCLLRPGTYFLNAGVVGVVGGEEVFLHRYIDVLAFRVQPEAGEIVTGLVDFLAEPTVSLLGSDPSPPETR